MFHSHLKATMGFSNDARRAGIKLAATAMVAIAANAPMSVNGSPGCKMRFSWRCASYTLHAHRGVAISGLPAGKVGSVQVNKLLRIADRKRA